MQGLDVGYSYRVRDNRAYARASTGSNGYALLLRPVNEVPDYEIIIGISHAADYAELVLGAVELAPCGRAVALFKPLRSELSEVFHRRASVGRGVRRDKCIVLFGVALFIEVERRLGHLVGNNAGVRNRLRKVRKQRRHFVARLEIKFVGREFHSFGVVELLFHLYAHQNVLHFGVLAFQIMHIVGRDKLDPYLVR